MWEGRGLRLGRVLGAGRRGDLGASAAPSPTANFSGTIIAAAGINIGHFANFSGRALSFGGTVTTDAVSIAVPTCAAFAPLAGAAVPALSPLTMLLQALLLALAGFAMLRLRRR